MQFATYATLMQHVPTEEDLLRTEILIPQNIKLL
jgi:hypothetical protein